MKNEPWRHYRTSMRKWQRIEKEAVSTVLINTRMKKEIV